MGNYTYLLAAAAMPLFGLLMKKFIGWLEALAFKHLPEGKLRSALITGWSGTTPKTLEELRGQRD